MARQFFLRSTLLFFSFWLLGSQVSPAQAGKVAPVLAVVRSDYDPLTEELFEGALKHIWVMAGAGSNEYEAGFALNRIGDHYQIVYAPMTYERNMELRIPVNTIGVTVAIAHTHPNSGQDVPSSQDFPGRDGGDVSSPVPNFVVSRSGLWVTNPADHTYRRISGPGWRHDLHALEVSRVLIAPPTWFTTARFLDDRPVPDAPIAPLAWKREGQP
jgi:hypothetical protein